MLPRTVFIVPRLFWVLKRHVDNLRDTVLLLLQKNVNGSKLRFGHLRLSCLQQATSLKSLFKVSITNFCCVIYSHSIIKFSQTEYHYSIQYSTINFVHIAHQYINHKLQH